MSESEQSCTQSECVYRDALERENKNLAVLLKKSFEARVAWDVRHAKEFDRAESAEKERDYYKKSIADYIDGNYPQTNKLKSKIDKCDHELAKQEPMKITLPKMVLVPKQLLDEVEKKLEIYRDYSDGSYHGGIEHTTLIKMINEARGEE